MQQVAESRSFGLSAGLHILVLLIAAFGLPALLPKTPDPVPLVMSVELLPISEMSNVKPSEDPIQKELQKTPPPKAQKPLPPQVKEPVKAPPPPAEKQFNPMEDAEALPEKQKPKEVKKEEPKKEEKKDDPKKEEKKANEDFTKLLNKLQQEAKVEPPPKDAPKGTAATPQNLTKSDAPYDNSMPMSISEKDAIRSQFIPCWNMPAGAKDANKLAALVKVKLQPDGTVISAELDSSQSGKYASDPFFRAAADSAVRAVYKCSPLKNLPADKYGSWREMEINFDPKDL